jgi:hypothetical protein
MFENFHPGFIFFLVGLFACVGSYKLRKMILACGPFLALIAIFNLPLGLEQNFTFLQDWTSHYMYVDKLSWVFGLVFCIMGCIGGVFSCHNKSPLEAICSMGYVPVLLGTDGCYEPVPRLERSASVKPRCRYALHSGAYAERQLHPFRCRPETEPGPVPGAESGERTP